MGEFSQDLQLKENKNKSSDANMDGNADVNPLDDDEFNEAFKNLDLDNDPEPNHDVKAPVAKTMNGAMSAEDIEQQLRSQQDNTQQNKNSDENAAAKQNDDEEDLDQYEVMHHTPELKPDPREMVDEDPLNPPAWAADDNGDDDAADAFEGDFQFGVIDKDRDREHFKKTGHLSSDVPTIDHEEYERRKQLEEQQQKEKEMQAKAQQPQGPSKPPLHSNSHLQQQYNAYYGHAQQAPQDYPP